MSTTQSLGTPQAEGDVPEIREMERQRSVDALALLDTPQSPRLDRITRLAYEMFGVNVAINLIDHERQWSMSSAPGPRGETRRDFTFCTHTIEQPGLTLVPDAVLDDRFNTSPLVTSGEIRFYAGLPLVGQGGEHVGALCVYDASLRQFTEHDEKILRDLVAWAQDELDLASDLAKASKVQQGLLPLPLVSLSGYEVAGLSQPMHAVGGDFYDWYPVRGGAAFTVGDVMGKGMPAALIAATARAMMRAASRMDGPAVAVESAADDLDADLEGAGVFVTLFHGHLQSETGVLRYIDAGHGLSLVLHTDGTTERLESTGVPLGAGWENAWEERTVRLQPGDTLVSVSDGVLDSFGGTLDVLERVEGLARSAASADDIVRKIAAAAVPNAPDDVTVIAVRRQDTSDPGL